jgi:hypothetical protein
VPKKKRRVVQISVGGNCVGGLRGGKHLFSWGDRKRRAGVGDHTVSEILSEVYLTQVQTFVLEDIFYYQITTQ